MEYQITIIPIIGQNDALLVRSARQYLGILAARRIFDYGGDIMSARA